jgi:hypothetical protein
MVPIPATGIAEHKQSAAKEVSKRDFTVFSFDFGNYS